MGPLIYFLNLKKEKKRNKKEKRSIENYNPKFESVWILNFKVFEFGFYILKFGDVWILHLDVLEVRFYPLKFGGVSILHPQILKL